MDDAGVIQNLPQTCPGSNPLLTESIYLAGSMSKTISPTLLWWGEVLQAE